jgi:hypothetical protein
MARAIPETPYPLYPGKSMKPLRHPQSFYKHFLNVHLTPSTSKNYIFYQVFGLLCLDEKGALVIMLNTKHKTQNTLVESWFSD